MPWSGSVPNAGRAAPICGGGRPGAPAPRFRPVGGPEDPCTRLLGPVLRIFSEPEDDGGDDQGGAEVGGSFGVAGGQRAELLEPGEAAFDDVASGVEVLVERRWPAAGRTLGLAPGDLV